MKKITIFHEESERGENIELENIPRLGEFVIINGKDYKVIQVSYDVSYPDITEIIAKGNNKANRSKNNG